MSATSVTALRCSIERVIRRYSNRGPAAEFLLNGKWLCCQAWFDAERHPQIAARGIPMTMQEAAIVQVSLQMAIDWLTEEMANSEAGEASKRNG